VILINYIPILELVISELKKTHLKQLYSQPKTQSTQCASLKQPKEQSKGDLQIIMTSLHLQMHTSVLNRFAQLRKRK